jgi:hypothetical protein
MDGVSKMSDVENIYEDARQYATEAQHEARQYVNDLDIDTLRKELIDSIGMVAYYTKIERQLSATPRLHYDGLRSAYKQLEADNLLAQAEKAAEEGVELSGTCRVKAKPLVDLLFRLRAILS